MSFQYVLDDAALVSIREQLVWLEEKAGNEIADLWMDSLEQCLDGLTTHPGRNGFATENGRIVPGVEVRQKRFRPWKGKPGWRVLYVIDEPGSVVTILQVRSERQPWVED